MNLKSMKYIVVTLLCAFLSLVVQGKEDVYYEVDGAGNVVVSRIVEGLSLSKEDIYLTGKKYIEESYKETKYKILYDSEENGTVVGEGEYYEFHNGNYYLNAYFVSAKFSLRVDAKDGRARLSISLNNYTGKRINQNKTADFCDKIVEFPPFNHKVETEEEGLPDTPNPSDVINDIGKTFTANDSYSTIEGRKRLYKKAFPKLLLKADATLNEMEQVLRSARSIKVDNNW